MAGTGSNSVGRAGVRPWKRRVFGEAGMRMPEPIASTSRLRETKGVATDQASAGYPVGGLHRDISRSARPASGSGAEPARPRGLSRPPAWDDGHALFVCPACESQREQEIDRRSARSRSAPPPEAAARLPTRSSSGVASALRSGRARGSLGPRATRRVRARHAVRPRASGPKASSRATSICMSSVPPTSAVPSRRLRTESTISS